MDISQQTLSQVTTYQNDKLTYPFEYVPFFFRVLLSSPSNVEKRVRIYAAKRFLLQQKKPKGFFCSLKKSFVSQNQLIDQKETQL